MQKRMQFAIAQNPASSYYYFSMPIDLDFEFNLAYKVAEEILGTRI